MSKHYSEFTLSSRTQTQGQIQGQSQVKPVLKVTSSSPPKTSATKIESNLSKMSPKSESVAVKSVPKTELKVVQAKVDRKKKRETDDVADMNILRFYKKKRVITIAYKLSWSENGYDVNYAGCIFRRDRPNENFKRRDHNQTAKQRCLLKPNVMYMPFKREVLDVMRSNTDQSKKTKEQKREWSQTEDGKKWILLRKEFENSMSVALRRAIVDNGIRSKKVVKN